MKTPRNSNTPTLHQKNLRRVRPSQGRKPFLKNGKPEQACPIMSLPCSESNLTQDCQRETMFQKHQGNTIQLEGL
ncbi:hypothetical protein Y1Q_0002164 [Alligator mississippiensis]|uniref:Uncharacterized protein n=1 Tax=Alligator mississippiensis TaxID=8496 RepID=A0A151MPS9_ALLMI|nr:hypothetical protein Y1Q_0002164 [Alligator mississippiensis]